MSTETPLSSGSLNGRTRMITGWLIDQGYKPDGRWTTEAEDDRVDYGPSEKLANNSVSRLTIAPTQLSRYQEIAWNN
jgi:hypothetical protein